MVYSHTSNSEVYFTCVHVSFLSSYNQLHQLEFQHSPYLQKIYVCMEKTALLNTTLAHTGIQIKVDCGESYFYGKVKELMRYMLCFSYHCPWPSTCNQCTVVSCPRGLLLALWAQQTALLHCTVPDDVRRVRVL